MKSTNEYTLEELKENSPAIYNSVERFVNIIKSANITEMTLKDDGTLIIVKEE